VATDVRLVTAARLPAPDPETERVREALGRRGLASEIRAWDDPGVDWSDAPVTVVRSTWDYTARREAFLGWAERVAASSALWNPPEVLRWNTHKAYLLELERRGVPVLPTELVRRGHPVDLQGLLRRRGWEEAVAKPAVGLGGVGARRVGRDPEADARHLEALLAEGDALVQVFAPSVESEGELSLVWLDGAVSHAVRKRPGAGEFRVHRRYGGREEPLEPGPAACRAALRALEACPGPRLYARVDLVEQAGALRVMEVELVEPALFLEPGSAGLKRLCDALEHRLATARSGEGRPCAGRG